MRARLLAASVVVVACTHAKGPIETKLFRGQTVISARYQLGQKAALAGQPSACGWVIGPAESPDRRCQAVRVAFDEPGALPVDGWFCPRDAIFRFTGGAPWTLVYESGNVRAELADGKPAAFPNGPPTAAALLDVETVPTNDTTFAEVLAPIRQVQPHFRVIVWPLVCEKALDNARYQQAIDAQKRE